MNLRKNYNSKEKGITLISLVITVVLLLIIASVLLMGFDENEILDATDYSIKDYKNDREAVANTVDEMTTNLDSIELLSTTKMQMIKEKIRTEDKEDLEISYTPEEVKDRLGDPIEITVPGAYSGSASDQIFTQENLGARGNNKIKWYAFYADDNGLYLVSEPTNKKISFGDSQGYDNSVYYLDLLSKNLFLNEPDFGVTESRVHAFRLSDIRKAAEWYNGTSYDWEARVADRAPNKGDYYKIATQQSNSYKFWPGLYSKYLANGNMTILDGPESEKAGNLITDDTGIERNVTGNPATTLTVTGKFFDYDSSDDVASRLSLLDNLCSNDEDGYGRTSIVQDEILESDGSRYWLATREIKSGTMIHFYLMSIREGIIDHDGLCYSSGYYQTSGEEDHKFRVVVSIPSEHVDIDTDGNITLK